jgi:hypothetical protein
VAIRGEQVMQMITFEQENAQKDSLMVTPIGICLSYYEQGNHFIFVLFEDTRLKMYDNGTLSVADAAIQAQFPNEYLFPRRGNALTFLVNGKSKIVRGQLGEAAVITLNGEPADIHSKIQNGDHIRVVSSTMGEAANMTLGKLPEMSQPLRVAVNGAKIELPRIAKVGGVVRNEYYEIQSGDEIVISNYYSVKEIARFMDITIPKEATLCVNDSPANLSTKVYENFDIRWDLTGELLNQSFYENDDWILPEDTQIENISTKMDAAIVSETSSTDVPASALASTTTETEGKAGSDDVIHVIVNNQPVMLTGKSSYVFVDIFEAFPFDLNSGKGQTLETMLNGETAKYLQELRNGDTIQIYWRK